MTLKISVLTPSYQSGTYIERAIKSVLEQSYPYYEHIIYDGGSKDGTIDILKRYSHLHWVSEPDKGQSDAMNKAFEASTGEIVVYLNADDYFAPGAFEKVIETFKAKPATDMVVGNLEIVHVQNNHRQIDSPSIELMDVLNIATDTLYPKNPVSYFYRRELQQKIGPFTVENHNTMDIGFLYRAFWLGKTEKIEEVLGTFLNDGANKTSDTYAMFRSLFRTTYAFVKESQIMPVDKWIDSQIDVFTKMKLEAYMPYKELNDVYQSKWWQLGVVLTGVKNKVLGRK